MKIGVSTTPWAVCSRPRRARVFGSFVMSSNFMKSNEVARRVSPILEFTEWRLFDPAAIYSDRTACVKTAPGRRINRSGHVPSKNDTLFPSGRIRNRHGLQQCLCIWVLRLGANLPARAHLHELAKVHD